MNNVQCLYNVTYNIYYNTVFCINVIELKNNQKKNSVEIKEILQ